MINLVIMAKCLTSAYAVSHLAKDDFLKGIIAVPARRALEKEKIDSLEKLSGYSEDEIMRLHGFGRNTMDKLKLYMDEQRVSFKDQLL